jgi:predicted alpha/beta hydrolase family esterase
VTSIVFIQGGGAGAREADAKLARRLGRELGDDFSVDFPTVPDEDNPDYDRWRPAIAAAITRATPPVVVVGHSLGGYFLVRYLSSERIETSVAAVCIIAAPFPSGDPAWVFEGFELPDRFGERLPTDAAVLLYASEDDETIPFAHRDLYAAAIPGAVKRTTSGGHQLGNDLAMVADDIRRIVG